MDRNDLRKLVESEVREMRGGSQSETLVTQLIMEHIDDYLAGLKKEIEKCLQ